METEESPLDVLSRAATMVQKTQALATSDLDTPKLHTTNQKQTMKWKRDRKGRLPEYTRKSDPKISETFGGSEVNSDAHGTRSQIPPSSTSNGHHSQNGQLHDTPLDMSLRQRGEPPSYAQTISNPGYRSNYRPSVIHNSNVRDELPLGISMCDPIIDEHFRRSLGSDYNTIFQNNNVTKESSAPVQRCPLPANVRSPPASSVIELMDSASLSVDDHFAKALGDTWAKLNRKDSDIKREGAKENLVSI